MVMRQAAPDPVTLEGGEGYGGGNGGELLAPLSLKPGDILADWEGHTATLPQEFLFQINNWGWKYYIFLSQKS